MEAKKKKQPVYTEQYKSQAVEMVIHSGKSVVQIARELECSEASLHGWKKAYLKRQQPVQIDGEQQSPEQMAQTIRQFTRLCVTLRSRCRFSRFNAQGLSWVPIKPGIRHDFAH
jgi:transposase-like protein